MKPEPQPGLDFPIIDAHTHTEFSGQPEPGSHIPYTLEEYLRALKEANVLGAVAHTSPSGGGYLDLKDRHVIHCVGIQAKVDVNRLEASLKSRRYGCIKIYLGYEHQYADSPHYEPAYRLARRFHVPVVFHTGDTYSIKAKLKYADPMRIDDVAVDHPDITFVIAHCGNPWIETAAELAYKNPNVYLDGSAFLVGSLDRFSPEEAEQLVVTPLRWIFRYVNDPSKLMFGSDWPLVNIKAYADIFKKAIPPQYWRQVFYDNAVRVFQIPGLARKESGKGVAPGHYVPAD